MLMLVEWPTFAASLHAAEGLPKVESSTVSGDYRLAPGDRLQVRVFDQDQQSGDFLSGDFFVDGSGGILLPLAGTVEVGGLSLSEAQQLIQQRFADGILVRPAVSLRLPEFRKIFVTGYVKKPGSYPFTFGLTVKAAIATAGGEGQSPEQPQSGVMSDFIVADERVRQLETSLMGLMVRKSRLEAQREAHSSFDVPLLVRFDADTVDLKEVKEVYAAESETLSRLVEMHDTQLETLQQQRPRIESEIQAVNDQVAQARARRDTVKERLADLEFLFDKGLLRKDALINQRIEQTLVEGEVSRLEAQLAHLRQTMGDLVLRIEDAKASYERQILSELQETTQRLREIEAVIGPVRRIRDLRAEYANLQNADYTIIISRTRGNNTTTINATSETILEPGDVVELKLNRREQGSSHQYVSPSAPTAPAAGAKTEANLEAN